MWLWIIMFFLIVIILGTLSYIYFKYKVNKINIQKTHPKVEKKYYYFEMDLKSKKVFFKTINHNIIELQFSIESFHNSICSCSNILIDNILIESNKEEIDFPKLNLLLKRMDDKVDQIFFRDISGENLYLLNINFNDKIMDNKIIGNFEGVLISNFVVEKKLFSIWQKSRTEEDFLKEVNVLIENKNISNGLFIYLKNKKINVNYENLFLNNITNYLFMLFLKDKYKNVILTNKNDILIVIKEKQQKNYDLLGLFWNETIKSNLIDFNKMFFDILIKENYYDLFLILGNNNNKNKIIDYNMKYNISTFENYSNRKSIEKKYEWLNTKINKIIKNINDENLIISKHKDENNLSDWIYFYKEYNTMNYLYFVSIKHRDEILKNIVNKISIRDFQKNNLYIFPLFSIDYFSKNKVLNFSSTSNSKLIFEVKDLELNKIKQYFKENDNIQKNVAKIFINLNSDVMYVIEELKPIEIYIEKKYNDKINLDFDLENKIIKINKYVKNNPRVKIHWID